MEKLFGFKSLKIPYGTKGKTLDFKNRYMIPPMDPSDQLSWKLLQLKVTGEFHLGVSDYEQEKSLKRIVDAVHADWYRKCKIGIQLNHAGRKCSSEVPMKRHLRSHIPKKDGGLESKSASTLPFFPSDQIPKELTEDEIKELVKKFADSAERAKRAGFDFIELHGAHGYLINQFLCSSTNLRKDKYGGSFENRIRFLCEIVDAIVKRIGEFPIFVRLSCDEGVRKMKKDDDEYNKKIKEANEKRWQMKDTIELTKILKKKGVCFIDCSSGAVNYDQDWSKGPMATPLFQIPFAHELKKALGDEIKCSCVGMIYKSHQVEDILKNGKADVVQLGRQALMNPYTPIWHAYGNEVSLKEFCDMFVPQHGYAPLRLFNVAPVLYKGLGGSEKK